MEAALAEVRVIAEVEPVFRNFCARRNALIRALTDEVEQFYAMCSPNGPVKEPLCLYGDSNEQWWVTPPAKIAPPYHDYPPQPVRGINLFRDGMSQDDWVDYVAHRSDLWLLSVAFFEGTSRTFLKEHRKSLYEKIDQLPQVLEVVRNRRNARAQVQQVFNDFMARRRALTRALTEDSDEFYRLCDPRAGKLCLFGDTNGLWRMGPPDENVPTGLPQPDRGINKYRDPMPKQTWLQWVADISHGWLLSLASFEATNNIGLRHPDRQRVFEMIHQLSTLSATVLDYQYRAP